ncbi:hypothetical protein U1Q18_036813 [Sarracenia purpurea var. burkii]
MGAEMMVSEDLWDIGQHSWYLLIVSGQHASHSFTEEPLLCHAWLIECLVDSLFRHGRAYVGWRFWCVSILKQGRDQALFEPSTGKDGEAGFLKRGLGVYVGLLFAATAGLNMSSGRVFVCVSYTSNPRYVHDPISSDLE